MRAVPGLLLALVSVAAHAQPASTAFCQNNPRFIGCLPLTTGVPAGASMPIGVGNDSRRVTLDQLARVVLPSLQPVQAVGANRARAMAERAGEAANVLDFTGADPTGASNSAPGFASAIGRATAAGVPTLVPPGAYRLDSVQDPGTNATMILQGTKFSGSPINGGVNWSAFQQWIALGTIKTTTTAGSDFTHVNTLQIGGTGASGSYLKAAGYDIAYSADPSSYSGTGTALDPYVITASRDSAGRLMQAISAPGNMRVSQVGANVQAIFSAGSDGSGGGLEVDVYNNSSFQALLDQPTTKVGMVIAAQGLYDTTAAIHVASGGRRVQDVLVMRQSAVTDKAVRMVATGGQTDLWSISAGGVMQGLKIGSGTTLEGAWPAQSVTVGAATGTLTTATGTVNAWKAGRATLLRAIVTITANGSGGQYVYADLPYGSQADAVCFGREQAAYGYPVMAFVAGGTNRLILQKMDGTYPGASGTRLVVNCAFEANS